MEIVYSDKVREARQRGIPIVALESTIISHGMPYPQNKEVAIKLESIIDSYGVCPATIAVLKGKVHIGLGPADLEFLASHNGGKTPVIKLSRRDVAAMLTRSDKAEVSGATTVATTMMFAAMANIRVFVTGGIGGVHRGDDWDISSDLMEFSKSPVAVIAAGAKSILDLPKTLEYLETQGVPVCGWQCDWFPQFFVRGDDKKGRLGVPANLKNLKEAAAMVKMQTEVLKSGMLVCNPIPKEKECVEAKSAIETALKEMAKKGIKGKEITPFLLKRVNELTKGKSLAANIALVENNAHLGAKIAKEMGWLALTQSKKNPQEEATRLSQTTYTTRRRNALTGSELTTPNRQSGRTAPGTLTGLPPLRNEEDVPKLTREQVERQQMLTNSRAGNEAIPPFDNYDLDILAQKQQKSETIGAGNKILVIGGATLDYVCRPHSKENKLGTSLPGKVYTQCGGVGRNIADAAASLYRSYYKKPTNGGVTLVTALGGDSGATVIREDCKAKGIALLNSCEQPSASNSGEQGSSSLNQSSSSSSSSAQTSAQYCAMLDGQGELIQAVADMDVMSNISIPKKLPWEDFHLIVIDANVEDKLLEKEMTTLLEESDTTLSSRCKLWFEPVSIPKAVKFLKAPDLFDLISPNWDELRGILDATNGGTKSDEEKDLLACISDFDDKFNGTTLLLTCGADGCYIASRKYDVTKRAVITSKKLRNKFSFEEIDSKKEGLHTCHIKAHEPEKQIKNCTGAGDTLLGVVSFALVYLQLSLVESTMLGMTGAVRTLHSDLPVAEDLPEILKDFEGERFRVEAAPPMLSSRL